MSGKFAWFDHSSEMSEQAVKFYGELCGWEARDMAPGMTVVSGENGPWAGFSKAQKTSAAKGWIPYIQVEDAEAALEKARKLGAESLRPVTKGPAGRFAVIRDPAGGVVALWQKG